MDAWWHDMPGGVEAPNNASSVYDLASPQYFAFKNIVGFGLSAATCTSRI
jgi:hypothetical protein